MIQRSFLPSARPTSSLAIVALIAMTLAVVACSDGLTPPGTTDAPATAQNATPKGDDAVSIRTVDMPPRIEGGLQRLQEVGTYPEPAKKAGIEGRVVVQFTVDETGAVTQPEITKGAHEMLDAAALKSVQQLSFEPGERDGQPVPVQMKLPITFKTDSGANAGQLPPTKGSDDRLSSTSGLPESAQLNIQFQPDGTPAVNGTPTSVDRLQHVAERWRTRMVQMNDGIDLSVRIDGDAPLSVRKRVWAQIQHAFPDPNVPYIPANS